MSDPLIRTDGHSSVPPIVISQELYARISRLAARAKMDPTELIELGLADLFNDPEMSPEALAQMIRQLTDDL